MIRRDGFDLAEPHPRTTASPSASQKGSPMSSFPQIDFKVKELVLFTKTGSTWDSTVEHKN